MSASLSVAAGSRLPCWSSSRIEDRVFGTSIWLKYQFSELRKSGSIVEVPHKERGTYLTVGSPIKFSAMKPEITGSPLLGEHSEEVLASLGYAAEEISRLRESQVI